MQRILLCMLAVCAVLGVEAKPTVKTIASPDGKLVVTVTVADDIRWSVEADGRTVLAPSQIAMQISEQRDVGRGSGACARPLSARSTRTVEAPSLQEGRGRGQVHDTDASVQGRLCR